MAERVDPLAKNILDACSSLDSTMELDISHLSELRLAVCSLNSRWYNIGISFGIPTNKLEEFRSKYRDPDRCLTCMLAEWVTNCNQKHAPPTWRKLVIAVASRIGGDNPALARKIAMKQDHCVSTVEWINVDNRPIGSAEMPVVTEILLKVATRWVAIGVLLGIPYDVLERFEYEDDLEKRVLKLVEAWLVKGLGTEKPTWKNLVEVIASRAGGDQQALAKNVAGVHPVSEEQAPLTTSGVDSSVTLNEKSFPADVLRRNDLGFLIRELRSIAPKWQMFSLQLGIPVDELDIIAAKPLLLSNAPVSFLQEALNFWTRQEHTKCTLNALCEVLRSKVVGESTLAEQVEAKFWEYRTKSDI